MKQHRTIDEERIDIIVYREYGSLDMLPTVLRTNPFLFQNDSMILKSGHTIFLPPVESQIPFTDRAVEKEEEVIGLW